MKKLLVLVFAALMLIGAVAAADDIKIGMLEDLSGDFSLCGTYKSHAMELAIKEINEAGGLLGKQLKLIAPDCQSDNQRYQEMARKLILEDEVDVIMGGVF